MTKRSLTKKTKSEQPLCLARTRESELDGYAVIGVDEAGRGPLAGPVVVAAAIVPHSIPGIMDSKLLVKEEERERLYEQLMESPNIQWALAVIDAARIDEVNILQATLEGMRLAAHAVMEPQDDVKEASVERQGSYVVCGPGAAVKTKPNFYALIDGNRLPKDMKCEAETIVKGDSKEYCIAAASILAKVTRDRLMHAYDKMYPCFQLSQHKGYPTAAHMSLVRKHGASPIHRRSFAPLKHMTFDKNGRVVTDDS
jgi:ribonuclease HII